MKLTLYCVGSALLAAALFGLGAHYGVWFERAHSNYWKDTTFECLEDWMECEEACRVEGVPL